MYFQNSKLELKTKKYVHICILRLLHFHLAQTAANICFVFVFVFVFVLVFANICIFYIVNWSWKLRIWSHLYSEAASPPPGTNGCKYENMDPGHLQIPLTFISYIITLDIVELQYHLWYLWYISTPRNQGQVSELISTFSQSKIQNMDPLSPYFIFVTTITTVGCVKKISQV